MFWRSKSYEVLPALSVRGPELRTSLRTVTLAWMYGVVWMSCVSGSHIKIYCRMLGFNDFAFGLLAALPFLATFGQLFATVLIERTGLRKYLFIHCVVAARALWFAVAAIPLVLPVPSTAAVAAMLVVLGLSWLLTAVGTPAFWTWMGDLIPRRIRGRYLAFRARVTSVVGLGVVVLIGILLDRTLEAGQPETAGDQPVLLYLIVGLLCVAGVFGVTDILLFRRIRELRRTTHDRLLPPVIDLVVAPPSGRGPLAVAGYAMRILGACVRQLLLDPIRDKVFRRYVCYGASIAFAMTVGGWFFWLNALENLGYSKLAANVTFLGVGAISGIITSRFWGRLIDRWGRRPILVLATFGTMFSAMPWFFVTRTTPGPAFLADLLNGLASFVGRLAGRGEMVWITPETPFGAYLAGIGACAIGGACWTGVNLAQVGVTLSFSDGSGRSKYVAASAVFISMGGILGGLAGGAVAQLFSYYEAHPIVVGPFLWNNWHATFVLSILARLVALGWLAGMPDPGARPVRAIVRAARANAYNAISTGLFYPLRIFGWRRNGKNGNGKSNGSNAADHGGA